MRQSGRFYIRSEVVRNQSEIARKIFRHLDFIPVRVEFLYFRDAFEYVGLSPLFENNPDSTEIPDYDVEYKDGEVVVYRKP